MLLKGALELLSNRSKLTRFAQVPERNSVSSSDSDLSAIYPWIRNNSEEASDWWSKLKRLLCYESQHQSQSNEKSLVQFDYEEAVSNYLGTQSTFKRFFAIYPNPNCICTYRVNFVNPLPRRNRCINIHTYIYICAYIYFCPGYQWRALRPQSRRLPLYIYACIYYIYVYVHTHIYVCIFLFFRWSMASPMVWRRMSGLSVSFYTKWWRSIYIYIYTYICIHVYISLSRW